MKDHHHKTWSEATGLPEVFARLDKLPTGRDFPDGFPEPIRFDPARKRHVYRGLMPNISYTFLHRLSQDIGYITALDELYVASSAAIVRARGTQRSLPWLFVVSCLIALAVITWVMFH